ncbi:hypothetical protein BGZ58_011307 [Dissophora ornata]|nr:hypothetical protein BGZ58_011307 [Dissophora ornata]
MSTDNTTIIAPNGCPIENLPEDPTRLFSSKGITLDLPRIGWIASGCFTVISTAISLVLIYRHCQYYTKPNQQRYIVRMLLMVPIYAITSWFSFVYVREAVYYDEIRVLYEAFVIASFLILLLQYLGDSLEEQKRVLKRHKKTERWFFPLCCLKYNPSRPHFLQYMKWGILQYVPVNVLSTILTIVLQFNGSYCEGSWSPKFGHVWILMLTTTSVTIATYFLIMFYFTIREDLKDYSPFYKFLAVKLVIFFSFWQSVLVEGLVYFGYITATTYWSTNDISVGIDAVLIDVEMVFFAIMHLKAFSYKPYVPLIPNPDLPQHRQALLANNDQNEDPNPNNTSGNNNGNINNNGQSLASVRSDPNAKSNGKNKDKEPPEMIMDFSQKTPIWKGILDSFNPLDTLRELGYGVQYMYRWLRGIPVDKDSRRLLDLERAFGRQRPDVPYIPPKNEEKEKDKKKKKKKRDVNGLDSGDDGNDDEDDNDDEKDANNKDGDGIEDLDVGRPNQNRDLERGYGPGNDGATDRYYRRFPDQNPGFDYGAQGAASQRRADTSYDMGYGLAGSSYPMDTLRSGGVGGAAGAGRSTAARKPVKRPDITNMSSGAGNTPTAGGRPNANKQQPQTQSKRSVEYLEKEDASRTELATLPDIQPEPVERKAALSGLYADLPLSPIKIPESPGNSSMELPMPMGYYRSPYHTRYGSYEVRIRDWGREREREPLREGRDREPPRFEHRDRQLERAAAAPYVLPTPYIPLSTRPAIATGRSYSGTAAPGSAVSRMGADVDSSRNFVAKGDDSYLRERELDKGKGPAATVDTEIINRSTGGPSRLQNPRVTAMHYNDRALHENHESGDTDFESGAESAVAAAAAITVAGLFYHHREASRSDPEVSRFGLDREIHQEEPQYLEDQHQQQEHLQTQFYEPEPVASESLPPPATTATIDKSQIQQSLQYPDPQEDVDPIVAQYKQLQQRQRLQEQQQQQELQQQREQQRQQRQQQQGDAPRQLLKALPRRRNSLESLDSDSTASGGGIFRAHAAAVGIYNREYGYGPSGPGSARLKGSRYQRAYRYAMPLTQAVPPVQFYRFPEDREMYERKRREQQQLQLQSQQQQQQQPLLYGPSSLRSPPISQQPERLRDRDYDRDRDREREYDPRLYDRPIRQRQEQEYSRPYYDDYTRYTQRPEPSNLDYGRPDARYRSPPPSQMETRARPMYGAGSDMPRRSTRDYAEYRDQVEDGNNSSREVDVLFPASRYAAPFVRDYELQQREGRRRMTANSKSPLGPGSGMRMRNEFEDRTYGEGVLWTRPHLPPLPRSAGAGGPASFDRP